MKKKKKPAPRKARPAKKTRPAAKTKPAAKAKPAAKTKPQRKPAKPAKKGAAKPRKAAKSAKKPAKVKAAPLPAESDPSAYGTWAVVSGEMEEDEARAMVDELWWILNEPETYRKLNRLWEIMGPHKGRQPEEVHLRFRGDGALKVLSRQWHPTERWEEHGDGSLDYWLTIAPCWQVKRWIMGFLGDVFVVSPPGLRTLIRDNFIRGARKHGIDVSETDQA